MWERHSCGNDLLRMKKSPFKLKNFAYIQDYAAILPIHNETPYLMQKKTFLKTFQNFSILDQGTEQDQQGAKHTKGQHFPAKHSKGQHFLAKHSKGQHFPAKHSKGQHSPAKHYKGQHSPAKHSRGSQDWTETYFIVSRNCFLSQICSGILLKIFFK